MCRILLLLSSPLPLGSPSPGLRGSIGTARSANNGSFGRPGTGKPGGGSSNVAAVVGSSEKQFLLSKEKRRRSFFCCFRSNLRILIDTCLICTEAPCSDPSFSGKRSAFLKDPFFNETRKTHFRQGQAPCRGRSWRTRHIHSNSELLVGMGLKTPIQLPFSANMDEFISIQKISLVVHSQGAHCAPEWNCSGREKSTRQNPFGCVGRLGVLGCGSV